MKLASYVDKMNTFRDESDEGSAAVVEVDKRVRRAPKESAMAARKRKRSSGVRKKRDSQGRFIAAPKRKRKKARAASTVAAPKRKKRTKARQAVAASRRRRKKRSTGEVVAMAKKRRRKAKEAAAPRRRRRKARAAAIAAAPRRRRRRRAAKMNVAARRRRRRARAGAVGAGFAVAARRRRRRRARAGAVVAAPRRRRYRRRRARAGAAVAMKRYHRRRRSSRAGFALENPMSVGAGGVLFAGVMLAGGYAVTDFLDRWAATWGGPKDAQGKSLRTPEQQAALIEGAPTLTRSAVQAGAGLVGLVGAGMVRNNLGRLALGSIGMGAIVHLASQWIKVGVAKMVAGKDAKADSLGYALYHNVTEADDLAANLLKAEDAAKGMANGLPVGVGALSPLGYSAAVKSAAAALRPTTSSLTTSILPGGGGRGYAPPAYAPAGPEMLNPSSSPPQSISYTVTNGGGNGSLVSSAPSAPVLPYVASESPRMPASMTPVMPGSMSPGASMMPDFAESGMSPALPASSRSGNPNPPPCNSGFSPPGCQPMPTLKQVLNGAGSVFPVSSMGDRAMQRLTLQNAVNDLANKGCASACLSGLPGSFPEED